MDFEIKNVEKEILGISMPINAPSIAKPYIASIIKERIAKFFCIENIDAAIVFPTKKIDTKELVALLQSDSIDKTFTTKIEKCYCGAYRNFNEDSLCLLLSPTPHEKLIEIGKLLAKNLNLTELLLLNQYSYHKLYLLQSTTLDYKI